MKRKKGWIYGVGEVDLDYQYQVFEVVDGKRKLKWICPIYESWKQMLRRVYSPKLHDNFPTYKDTSVCQEWLKLSNFYSWMENKEWKDSEGKKMQLDKDFIKTGNKTYCPKYCAFVSHKVNSFVKLKPAYAKDLPLGVVENYLSDGSISYEASCQDPFKRFPRYIGYFSSPEEAHEAWRRKKHSYACELADSDYVKDERVAKALRERFSPTNWHTQKNNL